MYHQTPKQACLFNISESSCTINCILGKTLQCKTQHGRHRAWDQEIMPVFTEVGRAGQDTLLIFLMNKLLTKTVLQCKGFWKEWFKFEYLNNVKDPRSKMQITYSKVPRSCDAETTVWWVRNLLCSCWSMPSVGSAAIALCIGKNPYNPTEEKRKPKMQEGMSRQSRELRMQWHSLSLALFNCQKSNHGCSFNWLSGKGKQHQSSVMINTENRGRVLGCQWKVCFIKIEAIWTVLLFEC